jgi:predicted amidohydrolase YtcJ
MFDDDRWADREDSWIGADAAGESPEATIPKGHHADPFACPCCSNVFAETLRLAEISLSDHADSLHHSTQGRNSRPVLLVNARIITMNPESPEAECLVARDGRIDWIGDELDLPSEASADAQRIDMKGQVVLPGFVEPHMHLAPLAMLHSFENVGPFRFATMAEAVRRLKKVAETTEKGHWVVGRQLDPSLQEGPNALTCDMLDEASTTHPVFVYNASLHLAYCNSLALEIAGIDARTETPSGSELGRDAFGEPNGVLKGGPAMAMVARFNPALRNQNLAEACLGVFASANAVGITTLCDQGTGLFQGARELELYQGLRSSERMTARFRFCISQTLADQWDKTDIAWGDGDEWLRVTGWKVVSDGSNQGRTGLQREPFLDSDDKGIAYIEVAALQEAVETRLRKGWAICIHANGDAAIDRALDAYERARDLGLDPGARRCRIEHCSILHDEQIDRMADLGISPSFLIGHVYYWGKAFIDDVFGLEKASRLDRTASCEAKKIRWTIHSDDPVTEMNPLRCIENAVTRSMWRADELLSPEERVSVDSALRAMTIDAAWQCHSDHEVGSLEIGKFADFVFLEDDPRDVETCELGKIKIRETWVHGHRVYKAGADGGDRD